MVGTPSGQATKITCPVCNSVVQVESASPFPHARCEPCHLLLWKSRTFEAVVPLFEYRSMPDDISGYLVDREFQVVHNALELVPESAARDLRVLPVLELPDGLILAVSGSLNRESFDKLRFVLSQDLYVVPVSENWIDRKLDEVYGVDED